ncbi:MAG: heparinase II/III family protein [Paracoccaceae bacterium]
MPPALWTLKAVATRIRRAFARVRNGWRARTARAGRTPKAFQYYPEPRSIGSYAAGKQIEGGNLFLAGHLVEIAQGNIWDAPVPDEHFADELHGFGWLDDLAAIGDRPSRRLVQTWLLDWIGRYGKGRGPGWTPGVTGRRVVRWISHATFLLRGIDSEASPRFFRSLGRQINYLAGSWHSAPPGLSRFEALTGLIYAGLAIEGRERVLAPAVRAMGRECERRIDKDGGIPSRNPEELMEVFTLLTWAARTLTDTGRTVDPRHQAAIERIAPTLRALRLGDGSLARFNGGGRGREGRLDQALSDAGIRSGRREDLAMGFAQIAAGRTKLVIDCAVPAAVDYSAEAHAGTLAFEMSSGRRPVIVNCGPGYRFGPTWRRAARATAAHSTVGIERVSSSQFAPGGFVGRTFGERLTSGPRHVTFQRAQDLTGVWILATHDGYAPHQGLIHERRLFLDSSGSEVRGEDTLIAQDETHRATYDRYVAGAPKLGVMYHIHFHIHPDVEAELGMGGRAVSLRLKSGETWVFRQSGGSLDLTSSAYLDQSRVKPRNTRQIIVSARAVNHSGQVNWVLERTEDGHRSIRDYEPDADAPDPSSTD